MHMNTDAGPPKRKEKKKMVDHVVVKGIRKLARIGVRCSSNTDNQSNVASIYTTPHRY
jgi:hypothetical protein